jgi:hypothetical protein
VSSLVYEAARTVKENHGQGCKMILQDSKAKPGKWIRKR